MALLARIRSLRDRRHVDHEKQNLEYAQGKLQAKPSPFREGAPEKSQAQSVDPAGTRFIP